MSNTEQQTRRYDLKAIFDTMAFNLPNATLREGLAYELRELADAQNRNRLTLSYGRVGGRSAALWQAGVIGHETFEALKTARNQDKSQAEALIESRA
ncbi:hypothetical protein [Pseudomonas sp. 4810-S13]|uniref:hypothetical protein n=1 Tax=Pseudomonas sp. 4810-S13 TaxID=3120822 RepID=UPI0031B6B94B